MIDQSLLSTYRRLRGTSVTMNARHALAWARSLQRPTKYKWEVYGRHVAETAFMQEGFRVRIVVDYDEYPSSRYSTTDQDTGIRNPNYHHGDEYHSRSGEKYIQLESEYTVLDLAKDWNGRGMGLSKSVAWDEARKSLEREAESYLSEDYGEVIVTVEVYFDGHEVGSASISGIEMDRYQTPEREAEEVIVDYGLLDEALTEARSEVTSLHSAIHKSGLLPD